jgi:hypothetical protein
MSGRFAWASWGRWYKGSLRKLKEPHLLDKLEVPNAPTCRTARDPGPGAGREQAQGTSGPGATGSRAPAQGNSGPGAGRAPAQGSSGPGASRAPAHLRFQLGCRLGSPTRIADSDRWRVLRTTGSATHSLGPPGPAHAPPSPVRTAQRAGAASAKPPLGREPGARFDHEKDNEKISSGG